MQELTQINGTCHCGNIGFVYQFPSSESEITVRKCGCTFCQKHGGAWTSHRNGSLVVGINNEALVSKYNFGTKTADFYVCAGCGAVPFVLSEIENKEYAVVNVNTFDDVGDSSFSSSPTNFAGEDTGSRLERRARNWIPDVRVTSSAT